MTERITAAELRYGCRAVALTDPSELSPTAEAVTFVESLCDKMGGEDIAAEAAKRFLKSRAKTKRYELDHYLKWEAIVTVLRAKGHDLYTGRIFT